MLKNTWVLASGTYILNLLDWILTRHLFRLNPSGESNPIMLHALSNNADTVFKVLIMAVVMFSLAYSCERYIDKKTKNILMYGLFILYYLVAINNLAVCIVNGGII